MSAPAPAFMATNLRSGSANSLLQYDSDESSESSLSQQGSEHAPTQINYYSYLNYMMIFLVAGGLFLFCSVMMGVNFYNNFVNIMHLSDYNLLGFVFELAVVTLVAVTAFELAKDIKQTLKGISGRNQILMMIMASHITVIYRIIVSI